MVRTSARYPRYLMLVVGCRFLPEELTPPHCGQTGEDGGARRGVPCHRGRLELANAGWWRAGPGLRLPLGQAPG